MSIKHLLTAAAKVVNTTLGAVCTYTHKDDTVTENVNITIDRNKMVTDDNGMFAGYGVEATILIAEVPKLYDNETFVDDEGTKWQIAQLTKHTKAKWYVDIIEVI